MLPQFIRFNYKITLPQKKFIKLPINLEFYHIYVLLQSIFAGTSSSISDKPIQRTTGKSPKEQEFPLKCTKGNKKQTCPKNYYPTTTHNPDRPISSSNKTCPSYFRWIHEDLRHWKHTGITRTMVKQARKTAHFRLVIVKGKAYVEKYRESIQTRDMFSLWGILQLLRLYPGRLPDLELMFDCDDRPVVPSNDFLGPNAGPPPLFRYCSDWSSLDIVFPDWSFWGWYVNQSCFHFYLCAIYFVSVATVFGSLFVQYLSIKIIFGNFILNM